MEETALIQFDRARHALAQARSIDEAKLVRDQAEALRLYVRQQGESLEMQNDIAEIKLRAERRAGELLAEMERNPGSRTDLQPADIVSAGSEYQQALDETGINERTARRWQTEAAIPEPAFEQYVAEQKDSGEELTSAGLHRLGQRLKNDSKPHVAHNSGNNEWYTPPRFTEAGRRVMGAIDLDPASCAFANQFVRATRYYSIQDDGLERPWGGRVWMNPPYSGDLVPRFINKLVEHVKSGDVTEACVLVNNATETIWFQTALSVITCMCLIKGRIKFFSADGEPKYTGLQGQVVLYVGPNGARFAEEYGQFGAIFQARSIQQ